jgi:mannosyltransferase OCH1-like enzyme
MRADAARGFILHKHGGLYVDLDVEALKPMDTLLEGKTVRADPIRGRQTGPMLVK